MQVVLLKPADESLSLFGLPSSEVPIIPGMSRVKPGLLGFGAKGECVSAIFNTIAGLMSPLALPFSLLYLLPSCGGVRTRECANGRSTSPQAKFLRCNAGCAAKMPYSSVWYATE
jgi:hypothetical protein